MVPVALRPPFNILCVIDWSKSFQSIDKKQFYIFLFLLYCLYVQLLCGRIRVRREDAGLSFGVAEAPAY